MSGMRMTRRRFLGVSTGFAAGLSLSPLLTGTRTALAASGWVATAPPVPSLGYITTLVVGPSDSSTLLAGGDVHGLKRTTDAGRLWTQIDSGTWKAGRYGISAIAPHPFFKGTYYVLSGASDSRGAVYRTTNSGESWDLLARDVVTEPQAGEGVLRVYGRLLALHASSTTVANDVLYAASYRDGLYKSVDGGLTWAPIAFSNEGKNLTAVVLHPTDPGIVYVGWRKDTADWSDTTGGVMVSPNGGVKWSALTNTSIPVRDLVVDPNEPSSIYVAALTLGVWRLVNGKWSSPNTGLPLMTPVGGPTYFNAIEVNPTQTGHMLVGTGEGNASNTYGSVYSSLDRASTWTNLVTSDNVHPDATVIVPPYYYLGGTSDAIAAIRFAPPPPTQPNQPPPTIWVAGRSTAWYSTDLGANWYPSSAGLQGADGCFDIGIDPSPSSGSLYFGTPDWPLIRSDSSRQTFELVPPSQLSTVGSDVRALCFAFTTRRLLLGAGTKYLSVGNWGGLFEGNVGDGRNWTQTGKNLPSARVVGLATAPSNPDVVYAALARKGVYKSIDGGSSFALMSLAGLTTDQDSLFPQSFTKIPIAVHPTNPDAVYLFDHVNGLFVYSSSTGRWTNVSGGVDTSGTPVNTQAPYQGFALDPTRLSRLYVATSAGLFRSIDAGANWTKVAIAHTEGFGPVVVDPGTGMVFAATALPDESSALTDQPGIYVSADGGESWAGAYVDGRFAVNFGLLAVDPTTTMTTLWASTSAALFSLARL